MNLLKQPQIRILFTMLFFPCYLYAATTVVVEPVKNGSIRELLSFTGEIKPIVETIATTDVQGPLSEIKVQDGDPVKAGQIMFQIDPERFAIAARTAEASLTIAQQRREETHRDFERQKVLKEKNAVNEKAFDTSETAWINAKANLLKAQVDLDLARLNLTRSSVRAPIDGFFVSRNAYLGQGVAPGMELGRIINLSQVFVEARIPETQINLIHKKQVADLGEGTLGEVAHIDMYADSSRSFLVKILVPNQNLRFRANMFVRGDLVLQHFKDVPVFPLKAMVTRDGKPHVFLFQAQKAVLKGIRILAREGNLIHASGIQTNDPIIVFGQEGLSDGTDVQTAEAGMDSQP